MAAGTIEKAQSRGTFLQDTEGGFILEPEEIREDFVVEEEEARQTSNVPEFAVSETTGRIIYHQCKDCDKEFLTSSLLKDFGVEACDQCKMALRDSMYAMVTKSDAKRKYLLLDDDLEPHTTDGPPSLRFIERKNPLNEHWQKMRLYLRSQVELLSFTRFGGAEGLAAEIDRREEDSRKRKQDKYVQKVAKVRVPFFIDEELSCLFHTIDDSQMRKQTMTSTWRQPEIKAHEHVFPSESEVCLAMESLVIVVERPCRNLTRVLQSGARRAPLVASR